MTKNNAQPDDVATGERLRLARHAAGLTQDQLGSAVGVSYQQIQKYETGTNRISVSRLMALAKALGVSPVKLLGFNLSVGTLEQDEAITAIEERIRAVPKDRQSALLRSVDKLLDTFEGVPAERRRAA